MGNAADEQADPRFLVGQVLAGRYWLREHLGRGAMGDVFRARHAKLPRTFAVKVLHPELVQDEKTCRRFEREAELAGRLHHRNVVGVIDVGETARSRYLVMEYAEGVSLVDVIAGQAMATPRVINLAKQICDGLQHAHEHELIHRDLKPENIIVERTGDDEVPRIVDFGLAILRDGAGLDEVERLTTRGIVLGTPHYLAPETALGREVDHRIDLFALGVILYEMMTGVMPFDGDGVVVAQANLRAPTPPMSVRAPAVEVDPLLEGLVGKLMEKKPEDRLASAREVRSILDMIESERDKAATLLGINTPATPPPPVELRADDTPRTTDELLRASGSRRREWTIALAAIALLAVISFFILRRGGDEPAADVTVGETATPPVAMHVVALESPPTVVVPASVTMPVGPKKLPVQARPPTETARPTEAPSATVPRAQDVLALYQSLGRELKSIADRRDMTADDLWVRYRRVRIQDVMTSMTKRAEALAVLTAIDRETAKRFRGSAM